MSYFPASGILAEMILNCYFTFISLSYEGVAILKSYYYLYGSILLMSIRMDSCCDSSIDKPDEGNQGDEGKNKKNLLHTLHLLLIIHVSTTVGVEYLLYFVDATHAQREVDAKVLWTIWSIVYCKIIRSKEANLAVCTELHDGIKTVKVCWEHKKIYFSLHSYILSGLLVGEDQTIIY